MVVDHLSSLTCVRASRTTRRASCSRFRRREAWPSPSQRRAQLVKLANFAQATCDGLAGHIHCNCPLRFRQSWFTIIHLDQTQVALYRSDQYLDPQHASSRPALLLIRRKWAVHPNRTIFDLAKQLYLTSWEQSDPES